MTLLPEDKDPFSRFNPYAVLKLPPTASSKQIDEAAKNVKMKDLKKEEQAELKKMLVALKHNPTRVTVNALIVDKVDPAMVDDQLKNLPNLKTEKIKLPPIALDQVLIEGQSVDISQKDFKALKKIAEMEIDLEAVNALLSATNNLENDILFEI